MVAMRKLYLSLLLPFLLLITQQGALVHELSHYGGSHPIESEKKHEDDKLCKICLGFAHVMSAVKQDVFSASLLTHLRFHHATPTWTHVGEPAAPAARSRGPPLFL